MAVRFFPVCRVMQVPAARRPFSSQMDSPASRIAGSVLHSFPLPGKRFALQERSFSLNPSPTISPTPVVALKLLGNIAVAARDFPDNNWAWANIKCPIGSAASGFFVGHKKLVTDLDFCADRLITGSLDGTCKVWDVATTHLLNTLNHEGAMVHCLQVQGHTLVSGTSDTTASIWDLKTNTREFVLSGHTGPIHCIAIDDLLVATGSEDKTCRIWSTNTGKCKHVLKGHTDRISCLQFTDGTLVTGSEDQTCISWDPETGKLLQTFQHDAPVLSLEFQENTLVTVTADRTCTVWDLRDASTPLQVLKGKGITCMRLQDDLLVTASQDHTLWLWDLKTGKNQLIQSYSSEINRIVLRGNLVVVGLGYGNISVEDLSKHKSL